ncbi:MAG: GNAT family N-acetyltransferase [Acidimicrobiales bacterium]
MPQIRSVSAEELGRIPEIDVSEDATGIYVQRGARLERLTRTFRRDIRSPEEWAPEISTWIRFVHDGGRAFGSFEAGRMIGVAVVRVGLEKHTAQLAGLYVDLAWRHRGIASRLVEAAIGAAVATGARNLYVSAVPSDSAVGFYLNFGFQPVSTPHPVLFELEPDDIHMSLSMAVPEES